MNTQTLLQNLGIKELSPMQQNAIELIRNNINAVILAPTGSGKTLSFLLPLIETINTLSDEPQALILSPTRELALQTFSVLKETKAAVRALCCYGGRPAMEEHRQIQAQKPHIIIGTPGRLNDHIQKQNISTLTIKTLVVDEFDKMFELKFQDEVETLLQQLPSRQRCILISATRMKEIPQFVAFRHRQPATLDNLDTPTAPDITHHIIHSPQKDKLQTLDQLLRTIGSEQSVVFLNYREAVERTGKWLRQQGHNISIFHGALEQKDREAALNLFRSGSATTLISTDLSARGIDIPTLRNVIHYHLPQTLEAYTHRSGRSGRWDSQGRSFLILGPEEKEPDFGLKFENLNLTPPFPSPAQPLWATLYLSCGKHHKISKGDIVGYLCKQGGLRSDEIGLIDIRDRWSYVAIIRNKLRQTLNNLRGQKIKKHTVKTEEIRTR